MKASSRLRALTIVIIGLVIMLSACGNPSKESNMKVENETVADSTTKTETQPKSETPVESEMSQTDISEDTDEVEHEALTDDLQSTENTTTVSRKEEFLQKLQDTQTEVDQIEPTDSSTYALKAVEDFKYEIWDKLLNEIYSVLQEQLTNEEMDKLREEQREWIEYRDATALDASKKYEGGTQEHLEYSAVIANLTKERCYKLVKDYMP